MCDWKEDIMFLWFIFSMVSTVNGLYEMCGTRPAVGAQVRISNGRNAAPGAWPWIGRMFSDTGTFECVAVLIDEQWALTLPNCGNLQNATIVFGDTEIGGSSHYRQEVTMRRPLTHPEYVNLVQYDVAVVQLDTPVTITDFVRPVCLSRIQNEWEAYDNCWIAGWGYINAIGDRPQFLQEAPSRVIPPDQCQEKVEAGSGYYHETQVCGIQGINGEPSICPGDWGGPMMCYGDDEKWHLVGQFFAHIGPCGDAVTMYSRMSYLIDFITESIERIEECSLPDDKCNDGVTCVFVEEFCDGKELCPDGEDERDCPTTLPVGCEDTHESCPYWASIGECTANPSYMLVNCKQSCGVCEETIFCANTTCYNGGTCMDNSVGYVCECAEGWIGPNCRRAICSPSSIEVMPGLPVNLTSPGYPQNYPVSTTCRYTVSVPDGYKVLAEFLDFNLEFGYDFFQINTTVLSGSNAPNNYTSVDEFLNIVFTSDYAYRYKGFWLRLIAIDVTGINECLWNPCEFDGVCTDEDDGYSCECVDKRLGRNCITPVDYCGPQDINLNDEVSSFNLSSLHYFIGNVFGTIGYKCKYTVTAPEGHRVRVQFLDVSLSVSWDTLQVGGKVFSGYVDYISEDRSLEIVFVWQARGGTKGINLVLSDYLEPDGDECASQPCQNGGICYDNVNGFTCKCRRRFTGKTCQRGLSPCGRNSFMCNNGRCIKAFNVCDGRNHCGPGDDSDEFNCDCEFNCHNGRCIPERYVCDNNNNCGDQSDEFRPNC